MDESEEQPPLKRPCLEFQRTDNVDIAEEIKIPCSPGMSATISLPTTFPNLSSTQIKNTAAAASSLGITSATSPHSSSSAPIPATSIVLVSTVSSALIPATSSASTTNSSLASLTAITDTKVQHPPTSAASPQTEEPKLPSIAPKNDTVLIESSIDLPINPSESLVDSAVPKIVLDEEEAMDIDDSIVTNIRDVQKGSLDKSVADASLFLDDESCDTVMRKPEPVSNIREETLAGDPRLEALDIGITESASMDDADDSSVDASKVTINNLESSVDQSIAAEEGNEEQEDDDDTSKKSVKKRKKPRRSIFYKPRPERKRKEKEQEENTTTGLAGEQASVGSPVTNLDEDSQGSSSAKKEKEVRRFRYEVVVPESTEAFTVDKVMEYVWPLEGGYGEHYFVQEHISQYIGISSFKRKYPDLRRRPIDVSERDYLKELGVVSEIACDMGLTAVRSEDVMDILFADFPAKFEELSKHLSERRDNQLKQQGKVDYQLANIDKSKLHEYARQAAEEAALWNAALCREKREERRYTSEELKKLPLNSVCVGPLYEDLPQEEADQLGASADADHDGQIKSELPEEKGLLCKVCFFGKERNKAGKPEGLIVCAKCSSASHASCVDLNPSMIPRINSYSWQCMECKHCMQCKTAEDEDKMIFCDLCDRGYHIYCVGLRRVPQGRWHCKECAMCNSCGARTPAGGEVIKNAEWQHEDNKIGYATTLCVPCDRLWKRRQYCYVCLKVYKSIVEDSMVRCANCPKYIHREKHECSAMFEGEFLCLPCFKSSKTTILNHNRIIAAAKRKMASGF
ncbi:hypothetical protein HAZT_HAZT001025 [Hyalella azteca]|uniref:PHD-type domain-containing protein n=1 Tax=Hyalella azteca TaxID=294128 RepID=A0A6A0H4Q0_HYAAZ|nr:hypothetical protein HAZT_HAZT001025 [Hyalella azteca]